MEKRSISSDSSIRHRKDSSIEGKSLSLRLSTLHLCSLFFSDSFKRSFKRSGSISRRSSVRANANLTNTDRTPSQEHDVNHSSLSSKEGRNSCNSLTNSSGPNLNGILDSHFIENNPLTSSATIPLQNHQEGDDDDDDNPLVERIQTVDGLVQDIRVYQVYLLGMSGTGKCSLIRQFKSTEYRGIYDYSSSIGEWNRRSTSFLKSSLKAFLRSMLRQGKASFVATTNHSFISVGANRHSIYSRAKAGSVIKRARGGVDIYICLLIADL